MYELTIRAALPLNREAVKHSGYFPKTCPPLPPPSMPTRILSTYSHPLLNPSPSSLNLANPLSPHLLYS